MADSLYRQWVMLRQLPREPRSLSTRELWQRLCDQGYSVTKRTVERDLNSLSTQFGYTNEIRDGTSYWFWPRSASILDVPALDPAAALAFGLIQDHLTPILPAGVLDSLAAHFAAAGETLRSAQGNRLAIWRKKIRVLTRGPMLRVPTVISAVHREVSESLITGHQLRATYHSRGQNAEKELRLHPLALIVKEGVFYLIATAWGFADIRHYALHRFATAEALDECIAAPADFSIDRYLEQSKAFSYPTPAGEVKLVLLVDTGVAEHLRERSLSSDQVLQDEPGGWLRLTATVIDSQELRWWILGMGGNVKVVKPTKLAAEIAESLKAALRNYAGGRRAFAD